MSYQYINGIDDKIESKSENYNCKISPYDLWENRINLELLNIKDDIHKVYTIENNTFVDKLLLKQRTKKKLFLNMQNLKD